MNYELISNGYSLDLREGVPIPLDKSVADIKDIARRARDKTKEITLYNTPKNKAYFAGNFSFTSTENGIVFDPTQKQECIVKKNGLVILKGIIQLKKVVIKNKEPEFKCTVYSNVVDLFLLLSNISVDELDWSSYNHVLNKTTISDTWETGTGSGYYYPLIERGLSRLQPDEFRTTDLVPYVYLKEVLEKAFLAVGYRISSTFFNTAMFKSILYGYGGGELISLSPTAIAQRKVELTTGTMSSTPPATNLVLYTQFGRVESPAVASTEVTDLLGQNTSGVITIARNGNYNLTMSGSVSFAYPVTGGTFSYASPPTIDIYKNGIKVHTQNLGLSISTPSVKTIAIDTVLNLNSGDIITYSFWCGRVYMVGDVGKASSLVTSSNLGLILSSLDTTLTDGDTVELPVFIPNQTCSELFAGVVNHFNLFVQDPDDNGNVKIEPWINSYQATSIKTDISDVVDQGKDIEIQPTGNLQSKTMEWKFKQNKDLEAERYRTLYEQEYGDYTFDQASYFATGSKVVELPYSTIIPYEVATGIYIPRFVKQNSGGVIQPQQGTPRVMFRMELGVGSWKFNNDAGTSQTTVTDLPLVHHFDSYTIPTTDLNFQLVQELYYPATTVTTSNVYSTYYYPFIAELVSKAGQLVKLYVEWSAVDIKNLDFTKLIMYNGALFRLNSVSDFDDDVSLTTPIELIKVLTAKSKATARTTYLHPTDVSTKYYQPQPLTWSAVITQESTDAPVIAEVLTNTMGATITPSFEVDGKYFLSGFPSLGSNTEITQAFQGTNGITIVPSIYTSSSIVLVTQDNGVNENDLIPNFESDGSNYILTVQNHQ